MNKRTRSILENNKKKNSLNDKPCKLKDIHKVALYKYGYDYKKFIFLYKTCSTMSFKEKLTGKIINIRY